MKNLIFIFGITMIALLVLHSYLKARAVAATITAEPDAMRVAILQAEALKAALVSVEKLNESPEVIAEKRERILAKQKNLDTFVFA